MLFFVLTCTLVQVLFWGYAAGGALQRWRRAEPLPGGSTAPLPGVSLIICSRNERQNLELHLPLFLGQVYEGEWELLVVDDASQDGTWEWLQSIEKDAPVGRLRPLHLPQKTTPGKKAALAAGIARARYDWLLLSDADCKPASPYWLQTMLQTATAEPSTEIVLGYAPYTAQASWLNRWIRWETSYTAIQYLSAALLGFPYMGVGRNLLYSKAVYQRAGGFESHAELPGGDDDLLVNAQARAGNTRVCLHRQAWVWSQPKTTWGDWYRQKLRHAAPGARYRPLHALVLGLLALSYAGFYAGIIAGLLLGLLHPPTMLVLYLLRQTVWALTCWGWLSKFKQSGFFAFAWFLDIFVPCYYLVMAIGLSKGKNTRWK